MLIVENRMDKSVALYYDRKVYYEEMDEIMKAGRETPLKGKDELIMHIEQNKHALLTHLFTELKVKQPEKLHSVDLAAFDRAIKKYGYKHAFERLNLELIVFCGEYIREEHKGYWIAESNPSFPDEMIPLFIDRKGKKYDLDINNALQKTFLEKGKFSIAQIIQFALLPG
jgi:hypothetical protein